MTERNVAPASRAAGLRRAFDQAFAEPPRARAEESESLLGIGVAGDAYAVRLSEVAELFVDRTIVRMPSRASEFVGFAGLRGGIVPVYSIRRLLGYSPANEPARWLLLAAPGHSAAFAFDRFDGYLRASRPEILPASGGATRPHLSEVARLKDEPRPVVSLRSVLETLLKRNGLVGTHKEQ